MGKGGGSGGGSTNTVTSNSQPPAVFQNALMGALTNAQAASTIPYQNYPGQLQAGFSPDQLAGFGLVESTPGIAAPYINTAAQDINAATTPIWGNVQQYGSGPSQYFNPYVQNVVNATQAQFNNQNEQQQNQLRGNAASRGALGGDRLGVAQGVLAGQQQLAQAPVIAGLYNQGFGQAQQEFNQQQAAQIGANEANAWLNSQAGFGMANLGNQALQSTLTAAGALGNVGATQQAQAQQALNIPYEQWVAQQSYPFQTAGWLSGITGQLSNAAGGTASTTSPGPNPWSQAGGLALGTAGLLGQTGAFGSGGWLSGLFGPSTAAGSAAGTAGLTGASAAQLAALDASSAQGVGAAGQALSGFFANRGGAVPHRAAGGPVSVTLEKSPAGEGFGVPMLSVDPSTARAGTALPVGGFDNYFNQTVAGAYKPSMAAPAPAPAPVAATPAAPQLSPTDAANAQQAAALAPHFVSQYGPTLGNQMAALVAAGRDPTIALGGGQAYLNYAEGAGAGGGAPGVSGGFAGAAPGVSVSGTPGSYSTSVSGPNSFGTVGGILGGVVGGLAAPGIGGIAGGLAGKAAGTALGNSLGYGTQTSFDLTPGYNNVGMVADPLGIAGMTAGPATSLGMGMVGGTGTSGGASASGPDPGEVGMEGNDSNYARGGRLRGFADGGDVDDAQEAPLTFGGMGSPQMRDTSEPLPARYGSSPGISPWMALADAGFSVAAGRSPNALTNLGAGLQHGIESYMTHDQAARELAARVDEARARLAETKLYHEQTGQIAQGRLGLEAQHYGQTSDIEKQRLDLEKQRLDQGKYTWQPGVGPDPADPTKQIPGMYKLPSTGDEKPQFVPGVTTTTKPEAAMFGPAAVNPANADVHGEDYLKSLPNQTMASQVRALAEGRMQFPSGFALKSPYWQQMLTAVSQFDPSFDAINFNARANTRRDFASGVAARNVTSLNTVMGHIAALKSAGESLRNGDIPMVNSAVNWVKTATGKPEVNNFQTAADAVADELEKAFRGSAGAVTGIRNWRERLNPSASPEQQAGAWKELTTLLDSRIDALGDQYSRGMGKTTDGLTLLSPAAQKAYQAVSGRAPEVPTYSQTGKREVGTTGATAPEQTPQWRYSATGAQGFKAYSNDGKTWFNPDGSPIGTIPATP